MAIKVTPATRAPRGTKILTQAFFAAADEIPEAQRAAVVKAALAAIRDELKNDREKAKIAKAKIPAKAKTAAGKAKPVAKAPKKAAPAATKAGKPKKTAKAKAKPARKAAPKVVPEAPTETDAS